MRLRAVARHQPSVTNAAQYEEVDVYVHTFVDRILATLYARARTVPATGRSMSLAGRNKTALDRGSTSTVLAERDFGDDVGVVDDGTAFGADEGSGGIIEISGIRTAAVGA